MTSSTVRIASLAFAGLLTCFASSPLRSQADVSIPGSLRVSLEPDDAVLAGASWRVDGGSFQASGTEVQGLAPGHHVVDFSRPAGWSEPDPIEVVVVGGASNQIAAAYVPLHAFYFESVPPQTARHGQTLRLLVHTIDPDDPSSPTQGAPLSMTAAPQPVGPIAFDAASGELRYTPDVADRTDFTVTFTAAAPGGPVTGSFLVSPLPELPPEDSVIDFQNDNIEPESNDYVRIREEKSAQPEDFNHLARIVRKVSISGAWLVFEEGSLKMSLHDRFNGDKDIKEMTIYAERVTIRSLLSLPQTSVKIFARELRFEGAGQLDVTQASFLDPLIPADGKDGVNGPDVVVNVERFHADPSSSPRIVSRGVQGHPAVPGIDGGSGIGSGEACGSEEGLTIVYEFCNDTQLGERVDYCGSRRPVFGENAEPAGKPGEGGNGGTIFSTLDLTPFADLSPGLAGEKGRDTIGGTPTDLGTKAWAGPPNNPCSSFTVSRTTGLKGQDATAPPALRPIGFPGSVQVGPDAGAWLHPISVQSHLFFLKDLYLAGRPIAVRSSLLEYASGIALLKAGLPEGQEKAFFAQLQGEIESLLARIDSHLDYFGNPLTWVPMLSFEANLTAFRNEIDRAIPILYLSYWIEKAAEEAKSTRAAIVAAKAKLEEEIDAALDAYEAAQEEVPVLQDEAGQLEIKIAQLTQRLAQLEIDLVRRARENAAERHKVPFWKKAIGVIGVLAKSIPVGQPALGLAGAGLGLLSKFDSGNPTAGLDKIPSLIKSVTDTDYLGCLKEKKEEAKNDQEQDPKKKRSNRLGRLKACGALLVAGVSGIRDVLKETSASAEEIKAEIEKLRAAEPLFAQLTRDLEVLNAEKKVLSERLAAALSILTNFSTLVTQKLLAIDKVDENLNSVLEVLDHQALIQVSETTRQTKDRLLKFQYLMAKAFQYRTLRPYTGSFKLAGLFDELAALVEFHADNHVLSSEDFETLKGIYLAELGRIGDDILSEMETNGPDTSAPVSFRLGAAELEELNEKGQVTIDLARRKLFGASEENLRIVELRAPNPVVRVEGTITSNATMRLTFEHSGNSRIQNDGHGYLFTHYVTERVNPIRWGTFYDGITRQASQTTISAASESLLRVLLGLTDADSDSVLLFSRPGALTEIIVTKEVTADPGVSMDVEDLVLQLTYDYSQKSLRARDVHVEVNDGLLPLITVSQADLDGRSDGRGSFRRSFEGTKTLRFEAPATHGQWAFDHWEIGGVSSGAGGGAAIETSRAIEVTTTADLSLHAIYTVAGEPPPSGAFRRGDANRDGQVNISDPINTLAFLFLGGAPLGCEDGADANDDGRLDISDAVATLAFLFLGGADMPSPGPTVCGEDPTADSLPCDAGGCD